MNINPGVSIVEIRRNSEAEKTVAEHVSHTVVEELRNELVELSSLKEINYWDDVCREVMGKLNLGSIPRVIMLTKKRALLEAKIKEDQEKIMDLEEILISESPIMLRRWSPRCDTLSSQWFQLRTRWVTFLGIPYHLRMYEVMEKLCARFGNVNDHTKYGPTIGGVSGVQMKVKNCDVTSIPQFVPLVDLGGVVYPIRILLDLNDVCEQEGEDEQSKLRWCHLAGGQENLI